MMLMACRQAVTAALQPLGLKEILAEEKDQGKMKPRPYAVILWGDEDLRRMRKRVGHTDDAAAGTRTIHEQVSLRTIPLQVRLVAETTEALDDLVTRFLAGVPGKILHPQLGRIAVAHRGVETPPGEEVVRREATWEGIVEFTAPVIRNRTVPLLALANNVTLESEIQS